MEKKKQVEDHSTMETVTHLQLKRMSSTYKMVIPESVEKQIRQLCKSVWNIEWSGILFYKVEGSFEDDNLVITCQDIYPMDIGNSGYTEFDMSPEVANYMALHNNLIDCELGLVHSHHSMATFFSGTDTNTLLEEGKDRNNFVSLIVNNQGTYSAAITRKVKHETTMQDTMSYKFYDKGEIKKETDVTSETKEEVEYFYLNIQVEGLQETNQFLSKRIKEISDRKKAATRISKLVDENPIPYGTTSIGLGRVLNPSNVYKNPLNSRKPVQTTLWPEKGKKSDTDDNFNRFISGHGIPMQEDIMEEEVIDFTKHDITRGINDDDDVPRVIPFGDVNFDKKAVNLIVKQLVTCSLSVRNDTNINLKDWAKKMPKLFKNVFETEDDNFSRFEEWAEFFCGFLIEGCHDDRLEALGYELEEMEAILAYDVICELTSLQNGIGKNKYIEGYIEVLETYVDTNMF